MFCPKCGVFLLEKYLIRSKERNSEGVLIEYDATCPNCNTHMGRMKWGRLDISDALLEENPALVHYNQDDPLWKPGKISPKRPKLGIPPLSPPQIGPLPVADYDERFPAAPKPETLELPASAAEQQPPCPCCGRPLPPGFQVPDAFRPRSRQPREHTERDGGGFGIHV